MNTSLTSTSVRGTLEEFRFGGYSSAMKAPQEVSTVEAISMWHRWAKAGGLAAHTADQYLSMVQDFFVTTGQEFRAVTPGDLVDWAESLNMRGPTVSSCGHKALTNFWKFLRANGLDDRALTEHMPFTQPRRRVPVAFSPDELATIFLKSKSISGGRFGSSAHLYFRFLYYTGARSRESRAVRLDDLSAQAVVLKETKGSSSGSGAERVIPLSPEAQLLVPAWRDEVKRRPWEDLVFPFGKTTPQYWCNRINEETGIHVHPHKFRATFATNLLSRGVDIRTVQELLGHADVSTTMRYLAVTDERKLQAVARL